MASYQARKRDPLLDSDTQAIIEKRSKELLGFALVAVGMLFAAMLWSYTRGVIHQTILRFDRQLMRWFKTGWAIPAQISATR